MGDNNATYEVVRVAGRVAARVDLSQVRLVRSSFTLLGSEEIGDDTENDISVEHRHVIQDGVLVYFVEVEVRALAETLEWGFDCAAVYLLSYEPAGGKLDFRDDELDAFGEVSAVTTVIPYARQLIQDMTARAGLPTFVLPLWKIGLPAADAQATPAIEPAADVS